MILPLSPFRKSSIQLRMLQMTFENGGHNTNYFIIAGNDVLKYFIEKLYTFSIFTRVDKNTKTFAIAL